MVPVDGVTPLRFVDCAARNSNLIIYLGRRFECATGSLGD
jgi:hypothetical protein